jgi:hypothetical protein
VCLAPAHHLAGFATGAALATLAHQPWWVAVGSACLASVTAGGVLSPDVDQFKLWRALDRWLPDEWLGEGGPLQHRGIIRNDVCRRVLTRVCRWPILKA